MSAVSGPMDRDADAMKRASQRLSTGPPCLFLPRAQLPSRHVATSSNAQVGFWIVRCSSQCFSGASDDSGRRKSREEFDALACLDRYTGSHPLPPLLHGGSEGYGTRLTAVFGLLCSADPLLLRYHQDSELSLAPPSPWFLFLLPASSLLSNAIFRQLRPPPAAPTASSGFPATAQGPPPRKMLKARNRVALASPSHVQPLCPTVSASAGSAHIYKLNVGSFTAIVEHLSSHVLSALLYLYHMQSPHQLPQSKRPEEEAPRHNQKLSAMPQHQRQATPAEPVMYMGYLPPSNNAGFYTRNPNFAQPQNASQRSTPAAHWNPNPSSPRVPLPPAIPPRRSIPLAVSSFPVVHPSSMGMPRSDSAAGQYRTTAHTPVPTSSSQQSGKPKSDAPQRHSGKASGKNKSKA